jgi:aminoglycoside/choline kinase family phosphotransferase
MDDLAEFRRLPLFQATYSDTTDDFFLKAWGRRGAFFDVLERSPQTFSHQDAIEGNLFWRHDPNGQGQLIGLDWAFTGIASVCEELAALVFMAMAFSPEEKLQLYETCLQGYLAGLATHDRCASAA